jgi:uroporphyrinogen-III synthase
VCDGTTLESVLPLSQRRVLVTRSRAQGPGLAARLEAVGAEVELIPAIEVAPPADEEPLRRAMAGLDRFDWVAVTSANAVEAMARWPRPEAGLPKFAAVGPATAQALMQAGFPVDLAPERFVAEALVEALLPFARGARVLAPRAAVARDLLPDALTAAGAEMTVVEAYRTVVPAGSVEALRRLLGGDKKLDAITFTSGSTATNLAELVRAAGVTLPGGVVLASIGPVTSGTMRDAGLNPTVEAAQATLGSLVEALVEWFGLRAGGDGIPFS